MEWTKDRPKEKGFYWMIEQPGQEPIIVEIDESFDPDDPDFDPEDIFVFSTECRWSCTFIEIRYLPDALWYGPITPPEPPAANYPDPHG